MTPTPHRTPTVVDHMMAVGRRVGRIIATHPVPAWIMAVIIWVPSYGLAAVSAVILLLHPLPAGQLPWDTDLRQAVASAATAILLVYLTLVFLHWRRYRIPDTGITPRKDRREWFWIPAAFVMACGANLIKMVMTDQAQAWFPDHTHLYRTNATSEHALPSLLVSMLTSGPVEEIVLVPGLILLLISGRCPRWLAITFAVVFRAAFHLYYGLPVAPGFLVWALLLVAIWQITGTALGAVLAHALNNFIAALGHTAVAGAHTWGQIYTGLSVAGIAMMIALIPHAIRTLRRIRSSSDLTHAVSCPPIRSSFAPRITQHHLTHTAKDKT